MYYICKFSGTWTILDKEDNTSQPLDPQEVELIKKLFKKLWGDKILETAQVNTILPNKLLLLPATKSPTTAKVVSTKPGSAENNKAA